MHLPRYINFDGSPFGTHGLVRLLTGALAKSGMPIALFISAIAAFPLANQQSAFMTLLAFNVLTLLLVLVLDKGFSALMLREPATSVIDKTGQAEGDPAVGMKTMTAQFFTALSYGLIGFMCFNPFHAFAYYCLANSLWNLYALLKLRRGTWSVSTHTSVPDKKVWHSELAARPMAARI